MFIFVNLQRIEQTLSSQRLQSEYRADKHVGIVKTSDFRNKNFLSLR